MIYFYRGGIILSFIGIALMMRDNSLFGLAGIILLMIGVSMTLKGRRIIDRKNKEDYRAKSNFIK
jgi:predicted tellurium resistance membrane protein TerC